MPGGNEHRPKGSLRTTGNTSAVRRLPEGRPIWKANPSEARSAEKKKSLLFVRSHYLQRFSRALDNILSGL